MDKIKTQSSKVGDLVFSADTGTTYKKALTLTWDILRETGILLWLVICLVFVGAEWFWKMSISLGRNARAWYQDLQSPSQEEPKSASEMGQSVLSALTLGAENLLYQAKKQLDIDAEPPAPKPAPQPKPIIKPQSPAPVPVQENQAALAAAAEKAAELEATKTAADTPKTPSIDEDE